MSSALRNAAESTAHTLSDLVDGARDLVDGARDRIEELPSMVGVNNRKHRKDSRWVVIAVVGVLGLVAFMLRRRHTDDSRPVEAPFRERAMAGT